MLVCVSSQSVSTSDAAAEAAVFCHAHTKPREAAAAGPPPAPTLQLHPQSLQHHTSSPHPETRPLRLPPRSDGKRWPLTVRKEHRQTWRRREMWSKEGGRTVDGDDRKWANAWVTFWTTAPFCFQEYYVPCTLSKKPLLILHFILRMKLSPILCFTNSRETAHRLERAVQTHYIKVLVCIFNCQACVAFISALLHSSADFSCWCSSLVESMPLSSPPDSLLVRERRRWSSLNKERSNCECARDVCVPFLNRRACRKTSDKQE